MSSHKPTSHSRATAGRSPAKRSKAVSKSRVGILPKGRKITIYVLSTGAWVTGGLWLIFHYFMTKKDEFGFDSVHPLQKWWLIGHAAFAFWALWMFGVLWPNHIKLGWNTRTRWISGGSLFLVVIWLTLTGFLLYYLGIERWRSWSSLAHWIPGLAGLIAFLVHVPLRSRATHSKPIS
jgi:hypothetical protein